MSFYEPQMAGPDWGGGINELLNMFIMYKLIEQMYPSEKGKKGKKGEKEGMPDIGNILMGETPLPPQQEMPPGLPMGQMGQPQSGIDIQQIMQMLGSIPSLMR